MNIDFVCNQMGPVAIAIASGEFSSLNNSLILEKKLASSNKGAKVTSGLSSESL